MLTWRAVVISGLLGALVGCSMLVSPDELSNGDESLTEGEITGDAGEKARHTSSSDAGQDGADEDSSASAASGGEPSAEGEGNGSGDSGGGAMPGEMDAGGGVTPPPSNPCAGKPDGFAYDGVATDRCCGGQPTKTNTTNNCGACGIQCPSGFGCGQAMPGKWGCNCSTNAQCEAAGYGAGATCYTDGTGSFCNCQCPTGAITCKNLCRGGATCTDDVGQNYCSY